MSWNSLQNVGKAERSSSRYEWLFSVASPPQEKKEKHLSNRSLYSHWHTISNHKNADYSRFKAVNLWSLPVRCILELQQMRAAAADSQSTYYNFDKQCIIHVEEQECGTDSMIYITSKSAISSQFLCCNTSLWKSWNISANTMHTLLRLNTES